MSKWWTERPLRMIQTNLREIDVIDFNLEEYVDSLREFSADVVLFNVGGIVANYPTELKYHYQNPHLEYDLLQEVLHRIHSEGIKLIARFDFSKINQAYAQEKPEWLYRSVEGNFVNYNGQVHTCINGDYQQRYSLKILSEVIKRYDIDGVFFNMFGYQTTDYSGNYHGICQCDNCKEKFEEYAGKVLPTDKDDPSYKDYAQFKSLTSKKLLKKTSSFIKEKDPDIAISTWAYNEYINIVRTESNTSLSRRLPDWNFSSSHHTKMVNNSWGEETVPSNTAVHFVDFPFRHSGVPPILTAQRIAQSMINGGWLDYYVIGTLNNQPDQTCFERIKPIFSFHKKHQDFFTETGSEADLCLIFPQERGAEGGRSEFRGIYQILSECHIPFDVLHSQQLSEPTEARNKLSNYDIVILPDGIGVGAEKGELLDSYVENGGKLLATGVTASGNPEKETAKSEQLPNAYGVLNIEELVEKKMGSYFKMEPEEREILTKLGKVDMIYVDSDLLSCEIDSNAKSLLKYVPECMFGPPEKCYCEEERDIPGIILNRFGQGRSSFFPWKLGSHYESAGNHAHRLLLQSVLENFMSLERKIELDCPPAVELSHRSSADQSYELIGLVNLLGQLGTNFTEPPGIEDISVRLKIEEEPGEIITLKSKEKLDFNFRKDENVVDFTLPELGLFEVIVVLNS